MVIVCPKCKLTRDLGAVRIPRRGMTATCPACGSHFPVRSEQQAVSSWRWALALVLLTGAVVWLGVDWKLDRKYDLQPGSWQGEMTYVGEKYPFEMVIERAKDGRMTGYMDWVSENPRYRLAIRGTYEGNHIIFEDYEFLERQGRSGLYDQQDVYIIGNEMTGTAKNGRASFRALQRAYAPK